MKSPCRNRTQNTVISFLLTAATATFLMLPITAAQAHDTLQSTDPANGSVLGAVPAQIGLTFDHAPLAIGSVIRVEDVTGTDWADGPVVITNNRVTEAVKPGSPEGKYTVTWRVASADGHAVEGTFTFTAGTANTTTGAPPSAAQASTTNEINGTLPTGLMVAGGGALLLILAFVGLAVTVKRRLNTPEI